jgi:hypothetical protein
MQRTVQEHNADASATEANGYLAAGQPGPQFKNKSNPRKKVAHKANINSFTH